MITLGLAAVGMLVIALPAEALTFLAMLLLPLLVTGIGVGLFVGPNANASFAQTEGRDAGIASAMVIAAQRTGTAVGLGILSALYALLPGGAASLLNEEIAAFITTAFAGAAALTLVVTKRSRLDVGDAAAHDSHFLQKVGHAASGCGVLLRRRKPLTFVRARA